MQPAKCALALRHQTHLTLALSTTRNHTSRRLSHTHKHSASDKLFTDAAREETEDHHPSQSSSKSPKIQSLEQEHENWTGEESMKDAVLRMLVDKYKPLRGPTILTAEQKLKQTPPKVSSSDVGVTTEPPQYIKPRSGSWANEPLLPSSETHKPWETTFKAPSGEGPLSIKTGGIPPPLVSGGALGGVRSTSGSLDERLVRQEKEKRKKAREAGRLSRAFESMLDYKLGIKREHRSLGNVDPTSVRGWNSLIEERIEKARSAGLFTNVKGRGQPLTRSTDESNPFIAREEFLMNRIIQRNGAIPPWVEAQSELDTAVRTFRELLRQSWARRALRVLTTENPPELLHKISLDQVKHLRDPDWVKKEQRYHETAISELNSLIRKYNGLAPYSVRRSHYYTCESEIERMYESCAEDIMRELQERIRDPGFMGNRGTTTRGPVGSTRAGSAKLGDAIPPPDQDPPPTSWRFWDLIREWFNSRFSSRSR